MAEGGEFHAGVAAPGDGAVHNTAKRSLDDIPPLTQVESLIRSRANTPNPFSRQHTSLDLDDYFVSLTESKKENENYQKLTAALDGSSGHSQTFQMASVYADAWQYPTKDDCAALYPGGLGDMHNVHIGIHSGKL